MKFNLLNIFFLFYFRLTFYSLLKPFTYPHPMIFNLPSSLLTMLESPVPYLIGINKAASFLNELDFDI